MSRIPPSLRSGVNGNRGYTNGYREDNGPGQYGYGSNDDAATRMGVTNGRNRQQRTGGYGGFSSADPDTPHVARPTSLERTRAHRRSGDRWSSSRSRSRPGTGRATEGSRQIEDVLQRIQQQWDFMTEDNCIPVQIALKLLDPSSLGLAHRYRDFQTTHNQLQEGLKVIVNEHHQGFNSSIGTFHKIQTSLSSSQQRVRTLKDSLVLAKYNLSTTKPELKGYATTSQNYDDMLQLLSMIEQLQLVPEKLEARISEKRFLTAVDILQDALRLIRKSEMENIGALSDIRVYLSNQEHSLTDILIEELHNHLYLKSPYCEDRWKVYAQNLPKANSGDQSPPPVDPRGRVLYSFLDKLDSAAIMIEDASRNPEADTFQYMQLIVESLNKMSRLDYAIDTIEQRLPVELFRVVEKSNNEVAQRHPSALRNYANRARGPMDLAPNQDDARSLLLNDLLWTLYARFEAIAEGHRAINDLIAGIVKRESLGDTSLLMRGFKELWKLYQSEMRSLLHDYLSTDGDTAYRSGQKSAGNGNVFQRTQRDRAKRMFKLSDMDVKSTDLATERDDLEFILKSSVPGLVSDSKRLNDVSPNDNQGSHDGSATGHKLLVEPSVFNMGILLPPSLDFLNRLKEVVPSGSDIVTTTLTSFLDDFLVNVFHPQLDETLVEFCAQAFIELDAFQQDPQWALHAQKPIFKGTSRFFALITAFCKMLDSLPHDQAFSQLIITQMVTYYDKCCGWYKALVSRSQPRPGTDRRLKASASFAEVGDILDKLLVLTDAEGGQIDEIMRQEVSLLISYINDNPLDDFDLLSDRKSIAALCLLCTSMKWLASKIAQLRYISDRSTETSRQEPSRHQQKRRWTVITATGAGSEGTSVYLPLDKETAVAFDGIVKSYRDLASIALRTLHLEMRCHIILYISKSLEAPYNIEQPLNDPDPEVVALNTDLVGFDEEVSQHLLSSQQRFITNGLGLMLDELLVSKASGIGIMNEIGCSRMQLNILVLQQNLKNIESNARLSRSAQYYDYFTEGPDAIVAKAKDTGGNDLGFTYEELKVLVELCYSQALSSPRREMALQAKRGLDDHLVQLNEHLWQK